MNMRSDQNMVMGFSESTMTRDAKRQPGEKLSVLLQPVLLAGLRLRNAVAVAPMTRVSATQEGVPTERMARYYAAYAQGEFGLIVTEGIYPDREYGPGYARQPGLVTREQVNGWRRVTECVHEGGGLIFAQIMHAGALSQCLDETLAPSAVRPKGEKMPEYGGTGSFPFPREMTRKEIRTAIAKFGATAGRARDAGFDGLEIHGANGYLIDQFITQYTNLRNDEFGGDVNRRIRFACEVLEAARARLGEDFPVGIRLSQTKVNDFTHRWTEQDARAIFAAVKAAGASYIHVAGEGRDWCETARLSPGGPTITELARSVSGLPVVANGGMGNVGTAEGLLCDGHADLVSLGRDALANPDWPARVRRGDPLEHFDPHMLHPSATLEYADSWLAMRSRQ
jgi:2,4-dienoyl-CoA reductase-like NADH-dependent reductase (Old Yellow Enzyme family)